MDQLREVRDIYEGERNVVGVDIDFEEPLSADITLNTEVEDTEDSFSRLIEYLAVKLEYSMSMSLV